jgi:hypothetical protein
MLETTEKIFKELRQLRSDTEALVLNGSIDDMERYRFLMGRIDAYKMVESMMRDILSKRIEDEDF